MRRDRNNNATLLTVCCVLLVGWATGVNCAAAEPPQYAPVAAELIQPRGGLGNVLGKLRRGEQVRIAYLGGSITAANGWRVKSRKWFAEAFPQANVSEIHAAIGGTGSDLGVFRVQRDALQHRPDLLFVEFAVNDGAAPVHRIWKAMEGIVRQAWSVNSRMDVCFVYTFRVGFEDELRRGWCPQAASAMELLAEHYNIPSVNFGKQIVDLETAGKLIFKADNAPQEGQVHFSKDGVHPLDGGHVLYAKLLADAVMQMQNLPPVDHAAAMQTPFVADHWQAAKMVPLQPAMLEGDWQRLPAEEMLQRRFGHRMGQIWQAEKPGSKLKFRFRGSSVKVYDLLGPDGGQLLVTVNGQQRDRPVPRFDSYCTYHRIAALTLAGDSDPNAVHTVEVEIHPEQPDRSSVAFRLQDPETEPRSEKYQGTRIRISQILVLGDVVD